MKKQKTSLVIITRGYRMGLKNKRTQQVITDDPYPAKVIYLNFHQLEVVSRYRDTQIQVGEIHRYLLKLRPNICKF